MAMDPAEGRLMEVAGFKASAVAAGLRYPDRPDLGVIVSDGPVATAGVFTRNLVRAAPVVWSRQNLLTGPTPGLARAIMVNSGQANACTGPAGLAAARGSAQALARLIGCPEHEVLLASTGVIGEVFNLDRFERALPELVAGLRADGLPLVSRAMMTTDLRPKVASADGRIGRYPFTIVGLAKGAGMICPNMATMLSFILTDAAVTPGCLQSILARVSDKTFNRITIDGDTSTNDTLLAMASARAVNPPLDLKRTEGHEAFEASLTRVLADLSEMIVADGEGATKLVKIAVAGAVDENQAKAAAMTVANSPLVKTALFGEDVNWGRIMAALGRSGADFDPEQVDIFLNEIPLVLAGLSAGHEEAATAVMRQKNFSVIIHLKAGPAATEVLTCDLSYDYVKINADYRS